MRVQTARLGASYISDEISFALAEHALLDAHAFDRAQLGQMPPDAVLIGCIGDPDLLALRQLSDAPVLGLAQGLLANGASRGRREWAPCSDHRWTGVGTDASPFDCPAWVE